MANAIGAGTWFRAAQHLTSPGARSHELSHPVPNTMPSSLFSVPLKTEPRPTRGMRNAIHASNMETLAKSHIGNGKTLGAGTVIGARDIEVELEPLLH